MKFLFTTIIALFVFTNIQAQDFQVSSSVNVASGYGNYHPQIETLNDNSVGIIWTDAANNLLYFTKSNGTTTFNAPIQINPTGTQVQDYNWSGPDLAVWQNKIYIAYRDAGFETGHVFLVSSSDNGMTFSDTVRVDPPLVDQYAQFPDVAVFNDTVFVTYMVQGTVSLNPQFFVARSIDGGLTFDNYVDVTTWLGAEACDCCQPEIIADGNRVIVFFRQNDSNLREIKGVVSYDRGLTFTQLIEVDDHNWILAACPSVGPDARFLPNENVVVTYKTSVGGMPKVYLNEFNTTTNLSIAEMDIYMDGIANTGISYPQVAVDANSIGIVWEALGSGTDVFFNASTTGISGLQPTQTINVTNVTGSQSKPDITIANGIYHVVYAEISGAELKYVQIQNVTGINEVENELISVYPNPTSNYLTISFSDEIQNTSIRISNLQGEIVYQEIINNNCQINIENLVPGIYFLDIENENFHQTVKVVKQ